MQTVIQLLIRLVSLESELKTTFHHDVMEDKLHVKYSYDAQPVLEQNKIEREQFRTYKQSETMKGMVKVASLHPGDVERLANAGYNLMSPDPEEVKRALRYIQAEEKFLLTVEGKPISRKKVIWE